MNIELRAGNFQPSGEQFLVAVDEVTHDSTFDGQFYQPGDAMECTARRQIAEVCMELPNQAGLLAVNDLQLWAELDWKKPHGSTEMWRRLDEKLTEEAWFEVIEAAASIEPVLHDRRTGTPSNPVLREKAKDEAGDVLWVVTAMASNSGTNLSDALEQRLRDFNFRICSGDISLVEVDYYVARMLQDKKAPLKLSMLEPEEVDTESFDYDEFQPELSFRTITGALRLEAAQQFCYGDSSEETIILGGWYESKQPKIGKFAADTVIYLSYFAQRWLDCTLADIMLTNMLKITRRVEEGLVDKSDGVRTEG